MERPRKRPRISLFANQSPDIELDSARYQNDIVLKTRFEAIFEKYSQDFSEVGDEIDLETGEIVVNNGHLRGMDDERDTGATIKSGHQSAAETSKSMLRAMTALPVDDSADDNFNPTADEVLMSIEEMAENAGFGSEDDIESEDGLSDDENSSSQDTVSAAPWEVEVHSDHDSLFDVRDEERDSSPDSLFAEETPASATKQNESLQDSGTSTGEDLSVLDDADDEAVIARFGPKVGQEVLQLLEKRKDAHIEPAWRVPANICPKPTLPQATEKSHTPLVEPPSPIRDHGLWKAPRRKPRKPKSHDRARRIGRAESDDPLQEDFSSDRDEQDMHLTPRRRPVIDDDDSEDEYVPPPGLHKSVKALQSNLDREDEYATPERSSTPEEPQYISDLDIFLLELDQEKRHEYEEALKLLEEGVCAFCQARHTCMQGTIAHWTRLVRKWRNGETIENHDMDFLYAHRGDKKKWPRSKRFFLIDFRALVELHEGAGMTFKEIWESNTLRTGKTVGELQDIYDQYRTPAISDYLRQGRRKWTTEEETILTELCKNPQNTVKSIQRGALKDREDIDIGDKLADGWLAKLRSRRRDSTVVRESINPQPQSKSPTVADSIEDMPHIKQESEDEI